MSNIEQGVETIEEIDELPMIETKSAIVADDGEIVTGSSHIDIVREMGESRELATNPDRAGWMVYRGVGDPVFVSFSDYEKGGQFSECIRQKLGVTLPTFNGKISGEGRVKKIGNHTLEDAILLPSGEIILGDSHKGIIEANKLEPEEIAPQQIGWYIDGQFVSEADLESALTTDLLLKRIENQRSSD